ncbi:MAG: methyltransferase domain-containing protein [Myxococcales bacterium]|nr:methyltransferase domain-containing protein [Myxococcales bacterium]
MSEEISLEDFLRYFPYAPTALSIKECVRLKAMRGVVCPGPILDVGCGDGLFAKLAFHDAEVWGIDIDADEGRRAQASRAYSQIVLADITRARLPDSFFGSCVANCSLEHVPQLAAALENIRASLRVGASVHAFLPNRDWASHFLSARALSRAGFGRLSLTLQNAVNGVFQHHHLEDADGWRRRFERAGFEVTSVQPVGSTASTVAFEVFLAPSLLGLLSRRLTGRWALSPKARRLFASPVYGLVRAVLATSGEDAPSAEFLLSACRSR